MACADFQSQYVWETYTGNVYVKSDTFLLLVRHSKHIEKLNHKGHKIHFKAVDSRQNRRIDHFIYLDISVKTLNDISLRYIK